MDIHFIGVQYSEYVDDVESYYDKCLLSLVRLGYLSVYFLN